MRFNFTFNKGSNDTQGEDQVLQVTALAYLQDALAGERYEECSELIRSVKKYGATLAEIRAIIAEGARGVQKDRRAKAPARTNGRRRF